MKNTIEYIISTLRKAFYFCLPLIVCYYILINLKDFSTKDVLIILVFIVIYPKVKSFILGVNSTKEHLSDFNFNDAVSKELMRMQFKINELVNFNTPLFQTPKEMQQHPATMRHFREFIKYWQAYSAYPEIAACELLDDGKDNNEIYELCLQKENEELEENKIYLSNIDGKIAYSMIAAFRTPIKNKITDIESPSDFTLKSLNNLKRDIIDFAFERGHLEISAIIILKRTDGVSYYDPLSDIQDMTKQDLINLNSRGPISYKNTPIKKSAFLNAYVYDSKKFGFLMPDESEIKILSVEKDPSDFLFNKDITIEIQRIYGQSPYYFGFEGEKRGDAVTKIIKYANL